MDRNEQKQLINERKSVETTGKPTETSTGYKQAEMTDNRVETKRATGKQIEIDRSNQHMGRKEKQGIYS